ncbi:hypothetical protein ACQCN2_05070 [Brevibacillus ginsengisoli]|uniref:hypothetical protein n=1 Tax=Brevibacillus ginsengisoli TaxID=363854 RepID=UPI003CF2832D
MKKKEVNKLLKENPEFHNWIKKDSAKMSNIRKNPHEATNLFAKWRSETQKRPSMLDFHSLSEKSRRASQILGNVQNVMEMLAEFSKNEGNRL